MGCPIPSPTTGQSTNIASPAANVMIAINRCNWLDFCSLPPIRFLSFSLTLAHRAGLSLDKVQKYFKSNKPLCNRRSITTARFIASSDVPGQGMQGVHGSLHGAAKYYVVLLARPTILHCAALCCTVLPFTDTSHIA